MFNELVESVAVRKATNERWGFAVSLAVQSLCLLTLILVPLIYTQALPKAMFGTFLVAPAAPAPRPPAPPAAATLRAQRTERLFHDGVINEPVAIPLHVKLFQEPPIPPDAPTGFGVPGGDGGPDLFHFLNDSATHQSPAPPKALALPQENVATQRIPLGGMIEEAKLIVRVQPIYPTLAVQAHIQGNVVLHAIVGTDGRVSELQVISGHPLLVQSAMQAVNQWRYQPTLLNGQPVEVETTITVSFVLGG